jgi:hypothetical protein
VVEKYSEFGKSTETYLLKRKPSNELSSWLKIENFGKPEQTISFDVIWNDLMYSASYQGIIIKRIDTTLDEMMWCVLTARSKHLVGYDELEMLSSHPTLEYAEAWCEKYALRIRDTRGLTLTAQDLQE